MLVMKLENENAERLKNENAKASSNSDSVVYYTTCTIITVVCIDRRHQTVGWCCVGTKDHPRLSIARSLRAPQKGVPTDYSLLNPKDTPTDCSLLNPKDTVDLLLLKQRGTHSLRGIHLFEFLGVVLKRWLVGCFDTTIANQISR